MPQKKIIGYGLVHAIAAAVYVGLVAFLLSNPQRIFGERPGALGIMAVLLLLVTSVSVMGLAVLARPVMWYVDGRKQEAVRLILWTVGFLLVAVIVLFLILAEGNLDVLK